MQRTLFDKIFGKFQFGAEIRHFALQRLLCLAIEFRIVNQRVDEDEHVGLDEGWLDGLGNLAGAFVLLLDERNQYVGDFLAHVVNVRATTKRANAVDKAHLLVLIITRCDSNLPSTN
jgi:hypothetical protein